jgi:cytochrome c biogenesis protein ResB
MSAVQPSAFMLAPTRALVFEKRDKEVKAFLSHVTARQGSTMERAVISVNDPFTFGGWTLYQVNYNPEEPNYSGLEAVRDPGVTWVFLGFTLICLGVAYMFYVEPRLRGGGIERPASRPAAGTPS